MDRNGSNLITRVYSMLIYDQDYGRITQEVCSEIGLGVSNRDQSTYKIRDRFAWVRTSSCSEGAIRRADMAIRDYCVVKDNPILMYIRASGLDDKRKEELVTHAPDNSYLVFDDGDEVAFRERVKQTLEYLSRPFYRPDEIVSWLEGNGRESAYFWYREGENDPEPVQVDRNGSVLFLGDSVGNELSDCSGKFYGPLMNPIK